MPGCRFDDVIVGQGLAGTTLAWQLRHCGRSVLVIDHDVSVSSSSVAAGLMTPVTGQRLARSWRWEELWSTAREFYQQVEQETGAAFFAPQAMVRLFADPGEQEQFAARRAELGNLVRSPQPALDGDCFQFPHGGFEMPDAAYLNVPKYLHVSRTCFLNDGSYLTSSIEPDDVIPTDDGVALPRLKVRARHLTWCQGVDGITNRDFESVEFRPAKGEILRLRIPGLTERRIVHAAVWLLPLGGEQFLAGATYDWESIDRVPTPAGRDEIARGLRSFLKRPFQIIGHLAGVRPAVRDFRPVVGVHPRHHQLGIFNGFGSKGALYAPEFAVQLVQCLVNGAEIEREVGYRRWTSPAAEPSKPPRLTELAHRLVRSRLRPGDCAVDATAGNGRDTAFLAQTVGPTGRVIAIDIQEVAVQRTNSRLQSTGLKNVSVVHGDHSDLANFLPPEVRGCVGAIMFNLGYLPGGDHSVITRPGSTIAALRTALKELRSGGIVTVVAYPGHGGGAAEVAAVEELFLALPNCGWEVSGSSQTIAGQSVPRLFWATHR